MVWDHFPGETCHLLLRPLQAKNAFFFMKITIITTVGDWVGGGGGGGGGGGEQPRRTPFLPYEMEISL